MNVLQAPWHNFTLVNTIGFNFIFDSHTHTLVHGHAHDVKLYIQCHRYAHTHTHTHTHSPFHSHTRTHAHVHTCACACTCTYTHTHTHTHTLSQVGDADNVPVTPTSATIVTNSYEEEDSDGEVLDSTDWETSSGGEEEPQEVTS